jgi:ABC-type dipeptide/oligopeptide/nickel transport system ATPase subunit
MVITHDYSIISEVYAHYKALLPHIHFKELSRTDSDMVRLDDFSPEDYLGWLKGMHPPAAGHSAAEPVLTMDHTFEVFGRTLRIYRDAAHTRPCQMVIRKGELVYVKAPSGVGKTTLAKVIMGLYPAGKLSMRLGGTAATERTPHSFWTRQIWGRKAGMVFQHADEALNMEATVRETFNGLPLATKLSTDSLKARLGELFEGEISDAFLRKKVKYLSGGQKQRLNLLRTLILGTDLTILDEPLNALDFVSVKKVLAIIDQKRAKGAAQLMISHNEEIFDSMVDAEHLYYLAEVK